jgi:membrane protein implicated in regulation of membrane protease activity
MSTFTPDQHAVDDGPVQDQEQRDAKSVTIVTGFLLGAAVLALGLLMLWLADELIGVPQNVISSLTPAIEATALVVLVTYVAWNRRR